MQKYKATYTTKWALQDALRMLQTGSEVIPHIGFQREPREVTTHMNRDRPGGHKHTNDGKYWGQVDRKKKRLAEKKYAKEAVKDWWEYLEYGDYWENYYQDYTDYRDYRDYLNYLDYMEYREYREYLDNMEYWEDYYGEYHIE